MRSTSSTPWSTRSGHIERGPPNRTDCDAVRQPRRRIRLTDGWPVQPAVNARSRSLDGAGRKFSRCERHCGSASKRSPNGFASPLRPSPRGRTTGSPRSPVWRCRRLSTTYSRSPIRMSAPASPRSFGCRQHPATFLTRPKRIRHATVTAFRRGNDSRARGERDLIARWWRLWIPIRAGGPPRRASPRWSHRRWRGTARRGRSAPPVRPARTRHRRETAPHCTRSRWPAPAAAT